MVLTILVLYLLIIFLVGVWANKYNNGVTDYLLAGRRLGVWLGSFALVATLYGGGKVVGLSEKGFDVGLVSWWNGIGGGIGFVLISLIIFRMRKLALFTVPDFIMERYKSNSLRVMCCLLSLVALLGILASQVAAASSVLEMFGVGSMTGAIIVSVVFIIYTAVGGLWGATITDFIHIIVAVAGTITASVIVLVKAGGFSGLGAGMSSVEKGEFLSLTANWDISFMIWLALPLILYNMIGQDVYQRLFATKDGKVAKRAAWIAGIMLTVITIFPVIIGMGARALFPELTDSRLALPTVINQLLPDFVAGIVLAAVMAAIMSTANSILTAGTSHIINDLYLKGTTTAAKEKSEKEDRRLLGLSRIWTLILGGVAILVATILPSIVDGLLISYTLYTSGVFTPVVVGLLWKKGTVQGAYSSFIGGLLVAILGISGFTVGEFPIEVLSVLVALILYFVVSLLTYQPPVSKEEEFEKVVE
ncbi:sodium:solute symporter family protein [Oceanobacillus polygoni]|uniref:SSS family solute:Na+ symporter n=1 Tax=Oceanobacillus polygoni TaxID=1235259 RepID=A0A9X0YQE6_9BACI|nr:sodium:solute symporter family protein [Oceanobacillus polygoni]MBP2076892.1 SSS family solute:Na+ symporter [Oceanobacillus polygoni]